MGFLWDTDARRLGLGGPRIPAPLLDEADPRSPASLTSGHTPDTPDRTDPSAHTSPAGSTLRLGFISESPLRVFLGDELRQSLVSRSTSGLLLWTSGDETDPESVRGGLRIDAERTDSTLRAGSQLWSGFLDTDGRTLALARRRGEWAVGFAVSQGFTDGRVRVAPATGQRADLSAAARLWQMDAFRDRGGDRIGLRVGRLETSGLAAYALDPDVFNVGLDAGGWEGEIYGRWRTGPRNHLVIFGRWGEVESGENPLRQDNFRIGRARFSLQRKEAGGGLLRRTGTHESLITLSYSRFSAHTDGFASFAAIPGIIGETFSLDGGASMDLFWLSAGRRQRVGRSLSIAYGASGGRLIPRGGLRVGSSGSLFVPPYTLMDERFASGAVEVAGISAGLEYRRDRLLATVAVQAFAARLTGRLAEGAAPPPGAPPVRAQIPLIQSVEVQYRF